MYRVIFSGNMTTPADFMGFDSMYILNINLVFGLKNL